MQVWTWFLKSCSTVGILESDPKGKDRSSIRGHQHDRQSERTGDSNTGQACPGSATLYIHLTGELCRYSPVVLLQLSFKNYKTHNSKLLWEEFRSCVTSDWWKKKHNSCTARSSKNPFWAKRICVSLLWQDRGPARGQDWVWWKLLGLPTELGMGSLAAVGRDTKQLHLTADCFWGFSIQKGFLCYSSLPHTHINKYN